MTRKLRPAAELVSDIGSLAFTLRHHSTADIAEAVTFLRTVNPEMFDWLAKLLAAQASPEPAERKVKELEWVLNRVYDILRDEHGKSAAYSIDQAWCELPDYLAVSDTGETPT